MELSLQRLNLFKNRFHLVHSSYTGLRQVLDSIGWTHVDGIVLDLGVSSMQIDSAERGFSFLQDGPLDMRFDPTQPVTAQDLVNTLPEESLADIIWRYGEERNSRRIARAIAEQRPFHSTLELASLLARINRSKTSSFHPATRTFQALRIAVNHELTTWKPSSPRQWIPLSAVEDWQ